MESTEQSRTCTDAPRVPLRRRIPGATQRKPGPRPPFPEQHAVRRPVPRDLDAWWDAATEALAGAA
jgi:hypothetical protein